MALHLSAIRDFMIGHGQPVSIDFLQANYSTDVTSRVLWDMVAAGMVVLTANFEDLHASRAFIPDGHHSGNLQRLAVELDAKENGSDPLWPYVWVACQVWRWQATSRIVNPGHPGYQPKSVRPIASRLLELDHISGNCSNLSGSARTTLTMATDPSNKGTWDAYATTRVITLGPYR